VLSLANAILEKNIAVVQQYISMQTPLNRLDEYGYTPLMEAAIVDDVTMAQLLLSAGAEVNQQDLAGGTALHWAVENNNEQLCQLLLAAGANPNLYTTASESVLVKPLLRGQRSLMHLLREHGASLNFAKDFINTKLLGHRFDLTGQVDIVDPEGRFTEVDLEGFFLEFSLDVIRASLEDFCHNYAAKHWQEQFVCVEQVIQALARASELIHLQHYQIDASQHVARIRRLLNHELVIVPIGYQGHAICLVKYKDYLTVCNRRRVNSFADHLVIGRMQYPERFDLDLVQRCIYEKNSALFIESQLPQWLGLKPESRLMLKRQISGNCSWANIEAAVPVSLFYLCHPDGRWPSIVPRTAPAVQFYRQWCDWDKDRALGFCLQRFERASPAVKASIAALLAALLFQRCGAEFQKDLKRARRIVKVLRTPEYEYVLQNYIQIYQHYQPTQAGKNFMHLLERVEDPLLEDE
jgi:hypothetical protein